MSEEDGKEASNRTPPLEEEDVDDVIKGLDEYEIEQAQSLEEAAAASGSDTSSTENVQVKEENEPEPEPVPEERAIDVQEDPVKHHTPTNGASPAVDKASPGASCNSGTVPDIQPVKSEKKLKNPFAVLKQRLSFDSKDSAHEKDKKQHIKNKAKLDKMLQNVKVESLPQAFVVKYLGSKTSNGLYGLKFTREPVESLVQDISSNKKGTILPLMNVQVSTKGLLLAPHKANKADQMPIDMGLLPIEFISYGVQDIKYTRIFSYIVVREMSSKSKTLECHAMLCDSMVTARKLALAVSFAFKEYAKTLQGKPYKFKVDLQGQQVEEEVNQAEGDNDDEDC